MEQESRAPHRQPAEGLHLPKGTLEAGLGRADNSEKKSKSEKSKKKMPVARVVLSGAVSTFGARQPADNRSSEAVSTWQRLAAAERPLAGTIPEVEEKTTAIPLPTARRLAEDAKLLEGHGEIPLQAGTDTETGTSPEHLDNVLPFPMERVRAAAPEDRRDVAEAVDMREYRQQQQKVQAQAEQPPDMPPPLGSWMDSDKPHWPSSETDAPGAEMPHGRTFTGPGEPVTERVPVVPDIVPLAAAAAVAAERPARSIQVETVRQQTQATAEWLRTEPAAKTPSNERLATQPLVELLAAPAAAVALKTVSQSSSVERMSATPGGRPEMAMNTVQLIEIARTIKVDGASLQEIYESKQIDDEGLRAVVETYLRGGDVSRQVQREVDEKQKQFERDPFNRKRSRGQLRDALSSVKSKVVDATGSIAKSTSDVAGKAGRSLVGGAKHAQQRASDGSEIQQWAGIGAVVVIWAIILWLVLG